MIFLRGTENANDTLGGPYTRDSRERDSLERQHQFSLTEHNAWERIWRRGFTRKVYQLRPYHLAYFRMLEARGEHPYIESTGVPYYLRFSPYHDMPAKVY